MSLDDGLRGDFKQRDDSRDNCGNMQRDDCGMTAAQVGRDDCGMTRDDFSILL